MSIIEGNYTKLTLFTVNPHRPLSDWLYSFHDFSTIINNWV